MMRSYSLRRIGIVPAVTRLSLVLAACGFLAGLFMAIWAAVLTASFSIVTGIDLTRIGYFLLILFPLGGMVMMGICGAVTVFLFVVLYNLVAGWFGGIAVELDEEREE
jgi:hypothetical protein